MGTQKNEDQTTEQVTDNTTANAESTASAPSGNDDQLTAESTTSENTTSDESSDGAQEDTASSESTFGADAAGLTKDPVDPEVVETAIDEVHPVPETEQDFGQVADRLESETSGLERAADNTLRTGDGRVAWAEPGSHNAAVNGVQQDASGHFESANKTNSHQSGSRI